MAPLDGEGIERSPEIGGQPGLGGVPRKDTSKSTWAGLNVAQTRRYTCTKREGAEVVLMSQTFFEPEVAEEREPQPPAVLPSAEPAALTLSADDFSALEDRVVRAVELVKRERRARIAAEERASKAEAELADQSPALEQMKQEIRSLRAERDQVRQRVERLLTQLDALEL